MPVDAGDYRRAVFKYRSHELVDNAALYLMFICAKSADLILDRRVVAHLKHDVVGIVAVYLHDAAVAINDRAVVLLTVVSPAEVHYSGHSVVHIELADDIVLKLYRSSVRILLVQRHHRGEHRLYLVTGEETDEVYLVRAEVAHDAKLRAGLVEEPGRVVVLYAPVLRTGVLEVALEEEGSADRAVLEQLLCLAVRCHHALIVTEHERLAGACRRVHHRARLLERLRHRLFTENVFAGVQRGYCVLGVGEVRGADAYRVDVGVVEHLLRRRVCASAELRRSLCRALDIQVKEPRDLNIVACRVLGGMTPLGYCTTSENSYNQFFHCKSSYSNLC